MNRICKLSVPLVAVLAASACNGGSANLPSAPVASSQGAQVRALAAPSVVTPACQGSRRGQAQCDTLILPGGGRRAVAGWTATDIEEAYNLPSSSQGSGQIVAIVDAYDNPNVASDLAAYRSEFGLGTANFYKYNQSGVQGSYPRGNSGWGVEIDLDTQMVSTGCPNCTIYLIEAKNSNWSNLEAAEKEAVKLGATIVTNSYSGTGASASDYDTSGVTYVASSGDSGYGLEDPAAFQTVVAAGGTILSQGGGSRGWTDVVWNSPPSQCSGGCGTGGGCNSVNVAKPSWQSDPDCSLRTGSDVSSVAWNVAIYLSYGYTPGWYTVGGTSASSPLLASVFALAGNSTSQDGGKTFWANKGAGLYTVTSGTIVRCPAKYQGTYLCDAGTGQFGNFSGPDGWGVPNGASAF